MTRYLIAGMAIVIAILASLAGIFAYRYKDAAGALELSQQTNALYAKAIDRLTEQRKIDDKAVTAFNQGIAELAAKADQTADALKDLSNDPVAKAYLDTPLPANVKQLLGPK